MSCAASFRGFLDFGAALDGWRLALEVDAMELGAGAAVGVFG